MSAVQLMPGSRAALCAAGRMIHREQNESFLGCRETHFFAVNHPTCAGPGEGRRPRTSRIYPCNPRNLWRNHDQGRHRRDRPGHAPRSVRGARAARGGDGPGDSRLPAERARSGVGGRRRRRAEALHADSPGGPVRDRRAGGRRARRSTTACASRGATAPRARSTIRIATVRCSPVSICTCSPKARTSARSSGWARAASSTAFATACTSRCGRRTRDASAWSATSTGGTGACTRCARCCPGGYWEIFLPGPRHRRSLQVRDLIGADGVPVLKSDPCGRYFERPPDTASIVWDSSDYAVARRGVDGVTPRPRPVAAPADVDLRSASRQLAALAGWPPADVSRAGRDARALRARPGLHARRAAAGDGASVHRLVGLSGDRVLRADQPLRHAGRLQVPRRCVSSRRHRRDARLGAGPFPEGPARPGALRRHRALRARRSAAGRAPGLGHADLQLRPSRSALVPPEQRPVLDRAISRRRPARRRRGLDALSRLLAQGRRVGAEQVRRPRESRGDRVPASS